MLPTEILHLFILLRNIIFEKSNEIKIDLQVKDFSVGVSNLIDLSGIFVQTNKSIDDRYDKKIINESCLCDINLKTTNLTYLCC